MDIVEKMNSRGGMRLEVHRRPDMDDEKINALRKERDEYTKKSQEIQNQIDQAVMELYETPDIVGKYICYHRESDTYLMHVRSISRLFRGVRIEGSVLIKSESGIVSILDDDDLTCSWDHLNKIEVLEPSEFQTITSAMVKEALINLNK